MEHSIDQERQASTASTQADTSNSNGGGISVGGAGDIGVSSTTTDVRGNNNHSEESNMVAVTSGSDNIKTRGTTHLSNTINHINSNINHARHFMNNDANFSINPLNALSNLALKKTLSNDSLHVNVMSASLQSPGSFMESENRNGKSQNDGLRVGQSEKKEKEDDQPKEDDGDDSYETENDTTKFGEFPTSDIQMDEEHAKNKKVNTTLAADAEVDMDIDLETEMGTDRDTTMKEAEPNSGINSAQLQLFEQCNTNKSSNDGIFLPSKITAASEAATTNSELPQLNTIHKYRSMSEPFLFHATHSALSGSNVLERAEHNDSNINGHLSSSIQQIISNSNNNYISYNTPNTIIRVTWTSKNNNNNSSSSNNNNNNNNNKPQILASQQQNMQTQLQMQWAQRAAKLSAPQAMHNPPMMPFVNQNKNSTNYVTPFQKAQVMIPTMHDSLEKRIRYLLYLQTTFETAPLPPINLDCLREIDLNEIIKNPQLRHDIIFDPLLQFRPNMDGERGLRKKLKADKYWNDVLLEISVIYNNQDENIESNDRFASLTSAPSTQEDYVNKLFSKDKSLLLPLFQSLKDILMSIIPKKDLENVHLIMDIDLILQEFLKKSINLTNFSNWLTTIFKNQCAPMRDSWVDTINENFVTADANKDIGLLVEALKSTFQLLEAMKLDIANHQIRMLRPALISNSVEFERQYFASLLKSKKIDKSHSVNWIYLDGVSPNTLESENGADSSSSLTVKNKVTIPEFFHIYVKNVVRLLSCKKMVKEYPITLSFDHTRLSLLRADIRQIVCLLIVRFLFKQLIGNEKNMSSEERIFILKNYSNKSLRDDILSIIIDDHGNCRWTKNTMAMAIHLVKKMHDLRMAFKNQKTTEFAAPVGTGNSQAGERPDATFQSVTASIDKYKIEFAKNWLSKQTQPTSEVYGVLEKRVLDNLVQIITKKSKCSNDGVLNQDFMHLVESGLIDNNENLNASITLKSKSLGTSSTSIGKSSSAVRTNPKSSEDASANNDKTLGLKQESSAAKTALSTKEGPAANAAGALNRGNTHVEKNAFDLEEFNALSTNLYIVISLHWSVFGTHYIDFMKEEIDV
ncbi:hypothetical protein ACO0QE_001473 [Hanseniaspora vineae]